VDFLGFSAPAGLHISVFTRRLGFGGFRQRTRTKLLLAKSLRSVDKAGEGALSYLVLRCKNKNGIDGCMYVKVNYSDSSEQSSWGRTEICRLRALGAAILRGGVSVFQQANSVIMWA
jgi:hypothetical protein